MGEVFKEVKEKFERFKFDVVYLDREYQINANIQQVPIPIGSKNGFTGIIINDGSAILTITLVKVAHASTASSQTSDVGTVTLNPGQVLKLHNFPVNEIQVTYNPNSIAGSTSTIRIKGVIHPLFESPVSLNIADILSLEKTNQNLLITANTTINNGVYDTIVISPNLTVNFDGFVVAKKLIIENNAYVNVNGVLVVDEIQSDGEITVNNFLTVKKMIYNNMTFFINGGAYVIADKIEFSPNTPSIVYNSDSNGNGNLFANLIRFKTTPNCTLNINANVTGKIIIEELMEISAGSLTSLSVTNIINADISISGYNLTVKFVKNAIINTISTQVYSAYFEFDNVQIGDGYFEGYNASGGVNNIYIVIKGNSTLGTFYVESPLNSYVYFRKNDEGEGIIQIISGAFYSTSVWYIDFGVVVTAYANFYSSSSQITCDGQLFLETYLTTTSATSTSSSVYLGLPFSIQGAGVAIIAYYGISYLEGNQLPMSNLTLAPGKYSSSTQTASGYGSYWYITAVQATVPGVYYLGLYDTTSGSTNYLAQIVIYVGTINQYNLKNVFGFVAEGAIPINTGNTYAIFNSSYSPGTITITGSVYI
jgi:hypothetical protein